MIEATPPECESWNFQLDNHWMESLDYRFFPITVNQHEATYRQDGSVRVVVDYARCELVEAGRNPAPPRIGGFEAISLVILVSAVGAWLAKQQGLGIIGARHHR